ncbi:MAG: hemerythrin domain-containing protein [Betaproteobacteria bacterium]|nr:hemerythrin domain-containing protein [Betaproteobacteria bacterium]
MHISQRLMHLGLEHQTAMKLAHGIRQLKPEDPSSLPAIAEHIRHIFSGDMLEHFAGEERFIVPILLQIGRQDLVERLHADHSRLGELADAMAAPTVELLEGFANLLREHVQFEEEVVFEAIEKAGR